MTILYRVRKAIENQRVQRIAQQKRQMERELRAQGFSRAGARAEVAKRFAK